MILLSKCLYNGNPLHAKDPIFTFIFLITGTIKKWFALKMSLTWLSNRIRLHFLNLIYVKLRGVIAPK